MSNNSLPDVNGGGAMLNNSQMSSDNYGSKREKKDDDGPLQCIERMTQQTLDRSPKINNRLDTNKRQYALVFPKIHILIIILLSEKIRNKNWLNLI